MVFGRAPFRTNLSFNQVLSIANHVARKTIRVSPEDRSVNFPEFSSNDPLVFELFSKLSSDEYEDSFNAMLHIGALALMEDRIHHLIDSAEKEIYPQLERFKLMFTRGKAEFTQTAQKKGDKAEIDIVELLGKNMPVDQPRYLMGVGKPTDLVKAILRGVDMFDCVLPARNARNGQIFTHDGVINIMNSAYSNDTSPIDKHSSIEYAKTFSKSYLRHLFKVNEMFGLRIATLTNIAYYLDLINEIKNEINNNTFVKWSDKYLKMYEN